MAGIKEEKKIYLVGIYCRLSKDDGTDNESASIATQKSILTDYVKKQGWHIAKTYVDDGYSGTNFQRPSFQNMIKDIESGLINCVITKDLSRLGRNYLDCGLYLEVFFPEHNVRYIAVNDGVDTAVNLRAWPWQTNKHVEGGVHGAVGCKYNCHIQDTARVTGAKSRVVYSTLEHDRSWPQTHCPTVRSP